VDATRPPGSKPDSALRSLTGRAPDDGSYACCIYRDLNGKLWVGTIEHGIYGFDGVRFEPLELPKAQQAGSTPDAK